VSLRPELRIAGSDTREAFETTTVRAAGQAAAVLSAPGWAAAFCASNAWGDALDISGTGAWLLPLCLLLAFGGGLASWRAGRERIAQLSRPVTALGSTPIVIVAILALAAWRADEPRFIALSLPFIALLSGLAVADCALLASRACVPSIRSAASGIIAAFAFVGLVPGVHLILVGTGAGLPRAAGWSAFYLAWGALALRRAHRALPGDRHRISIRERSKDPSADARTHALDMHAITVRFGPNVILDRTSLAVHAGELVALCGGNGAGKSTLLRVAGGFNAIESGQVLVAGEDVTTLRPEERVATGLSFVSGARPVFPELTVLQNLRVAAYRTHKTPSSFAAATDALLTLVPTLAARRDALVGVLSGGEQRLLAVTQTLYRKPVVLLADELTLGLDVDARHSVMDLLLVLAEEGVAVVAVDHDLPSLLPRAHRAAVVADGAVSWFDDPVELLTKRTDLLPATFLAGVEG